MSFSRGEVWRVDLTTDAKDGEIRKNRPCAVVNSDEIPEVYVTVINNDAIGALPLRIVVPLTKWQDHFSKAPWHIPIKANKTNGLTIDSSADTFQVRSISESRFIDKVGVLSEEDLENIKYGLAICLCIGY